MVEGRLMSQLVRDAGVWKPVKKKFIRDAGVWKPISSAFIRDNDIWKKFLASEVVYVGDAAALATSITTPSETRAGDLLVVFCTGIRMPNTPSGWTSIISRSHSTRHGHMVWRFADTDGAQIFSGFRNSQWTSVSVFRNAVIGASHSTRMNVFNILQAPTPNLHNKDNTSWVLMGVGVNRVSSLSNGPSPYIVRQSRYSSSLTTSLRDTNGPVSSAPVGQIVGSDNNPKIALAVEIKVMS